MLIDPSLHFCFSAASKKQRVRFSNIMEVRQLPSTQALEAKLSRMSYPAAKDHEAMLRTVGKLTITDVAKISFFFCFVVSKGQLFVLHGRTTHYLCVSFGRKVAINMFLLICLKKEKCCWQSGKWAGSDARLQVINHSGFQVMNCCFLNLQLICPSKKSNKKKRTSGKSRDFKDLRTLWEIHSKALKIW